MKKPYIRRTYIIITALFLSIFTVIACGTVQSVDADYNTDIPVSVSPSEYMKNQLDLVDDALVDFRVEQALNELNDAVQTVEEELTLVQDASIIEERNETVWTTASLRFRDYPSTENDEYIEMLPVGCKLIRIGICQNGWSQVKYNDVIGYVHSDYITTEKPVQLEDGDKGTYQAYALSLFGQYGWSSDELEPLIKLWNRESNWNPLAKNKKSGAYGIPQSLPGDKMAQFGDDWQTNYKTQIQWGLWYIDYRYGSPTKALEHSYKTGWY